MIESFYAARGERFELVFGVPIAIDRLGGEFAVLSGSVWLTRSGDVEDHLLRRGRRMHLSLGEHVIVERLHRDEFTIVAWLPRSRQLRAMCWRAVGQLADQASHFADSVAEALAVIARQARAASASVDY